MRRKIFWITLWVTMALWFGNLWADIGDPVGPADTADVSAAAESPNDAPSPAAPDPAETEPTAPAVVEEPTAPAAVEEPIVEVEAVADEAPQATDVAEVVAALPPIAWDRSNWPVTIFRPASGATVHHPVYFADFPPAARIEDSPTRLLAALGDAKADVYGMANTADLVIQPAKFCGDLVLLPINAAITWPWKPTTTP